MTISDTVLGMVPTIVATNVTEDIARRRLGASAPARRSMPRKKVRLVVVKKKLSEAEKKEIERRVREALLRMKVQSPKPTMKAPKRKMPKSTRLGKMRTIKLGRSGAVGLTRRVRNRRR